MQGGGEGASNNNPVSADGNKRLTGAVMGD